MKIDLFFSILKQFQIPSFHEITVKILKSGKIHKTYELHTSSQNKPNHFVLQKINTNVFPDIPALMFNMNLISSRFIKNHKTTLEIIKTKSRHLFFHEKNTETYWRLTKYIDNSFAVKSTLSLKIAKEAGKLLGEFHETSKNIPLHAVKPNFTSFHHPAKFYHLLIKTLIDPKRTDINHKKVKSLVFFIKKYQSFLDLHEDILIKKKINPMICHNDPKLSNMLFNRKTKENICMIDLDTVGPGYLLYDFGDAARSICFDVSSCSNKNVSFNLKRYYVFLESYIQSSKSKFNAKEIRHLKTGISLITLELCIRYLIDYLNKDQYFKINYEEENLDHSVKYKNLFEDILLKNL